MDYIQELTKQSVKILNKLGEKLDEATKLTSESVDNIGSIVVLKSKLEGYKKDLNKVYTSIGQIVVEDPDDDISELIEKAAGINKKINAINSQIVEEKSALIKRKDEIQDKISSKINTTIKSTKETLDTDAEKTKEFLNQEIEKIQEKLNKDLDDLSEKETSEKE